MNITHAPWLKAPETQKLLAALEAARAGAAGKGGGPDHQAGREQAQDGPAHPGKALSVP